MTQQTRKLFISYRQSDYSVFVDRIRDWLLQRFGDDSVFIDKDNLPKFTQFEEVIRKKIAEHDAVLVIIGPKWLKLLREKEKSGETDYVRMEIETALRQGNLVAPICIMGAKMPAKRDLPESLQPLCDTLAGHLSADVYFKQSINELMDELEAAMNARKPLPQAPAADAPSIVPETSAAETSPTATPAPPDLAIPAQEPVEQRPPSAQESSTSTSKKAPAAPKKKKTAETSPSSKSKPSQPAFREGAFVEVWVETKLLASPGGKQAGTAHPGRSLTVLGNGELNGVKYVQIVDRTQHLTGWVRANEVHLHDPSERPVSVDTPAKQTREPSTMAASPPKQSDVKPSAKSTKPTFKKDQRVEVQIRVGIYDNPGGKLVEVVDAGEILTVKSSQFVNEEEYVWVLDPVVSVSGWIRAHQIKPATRQQPPHAPASDPPAAKPNTIPRAEPSLPKFYPGLDVVTTTNAAMVNQPGDRELFARKTAQDTVLTVADTGTANGIQYVRVIDFTAGTHGWTREANVKPHPQFAPPPSFEVNQLVFTPRIYTWLWKEPGKATFDAESHWYINSYGEHTEQPAKVTETKTYNGMLWLRIVRRQASQKTEGWIRAIDAKLYVPPKPAASAIIGDMQHIDLSKLVLGTRPSTPSLKRTANWHVGQLVRLSLLAVNPQLVLYPGSVIGNLSGKSIAPGTTLEILEISMVNGTVWLRVKTKFSILSQEGWIGADSVTPSL